MKRPRTGRPAAALALVAIAAMAAAPLAAQIAIGDTVNLIEREAHIPAHPAPGDSHVTFRFESESQATVMDIDSASGWVRISGLAVGGQSAEGWITRRYIASTVPSVGDLMVDSLDWCPAKGAPAPHPKGRLRIATWNLGNLHADNGGSIFNDSVRRFDDDYQRIKCYVRLFDPDVLAVQEVDGEAALARVVDTDLYDLHVSSRPNTDLGGKQNTGFAYKKGLGVTERPDFAELDVANGRLRHGARIDLNHNGRTIELMSVHLKSGCFSNNSTNSGACDDLARQLPILEAWIDEAAAGPEPFIVLGDFNRRFNEPFDFAWSELDDLVPPNADLTAVTADKPISCRGNEFTRFIDHIVVDRRSLPWVELSSFRHVTFRQQDRPVWDRISDHCPVVVDLWIE